MNYLDSDKKNQKLFSSQLHKNVLVVSLICWFWPPYVKLFKSFESWLETLAAVKDKETSWDLEFEGIIHPQSGKRVEEAAKYVMSKIIWKVANFSFSINLFEQ